MRDFFRIFAALSFAGFMASATGQQSAPDSQPGSLALQAIKAKGATNANNVKSPEQPSDAGVADVARHLRGQDLEKVRVSPEEAEKILKSVQPVLRFASEDSGLPIHSLVKSRMISRDDLRNSMQEKKLNDDDVKHLQETELTLKKFGYVPRVFSTTTFVEGMYAELAAGFYDPRTKIITLLNWVTPEEQLSVLAHELTHALQDQNFNLMTWEHAEASKRHAPGQFQVSETEALMESDARRAVVEGQAMVVLIDHQWQEHGVEARLRFLPGASSALSQYMAMIPAPDTPTIHASPVVLRDGMGFPYREGLVFELELLGKGGTAFAFNRVFARPPSNTHEIMHPDAYLQREKIQTPEIPDLNSLLADQYEVIDAGGLGELDIRSLVRQFENTWLADHICRGWRGSSYLVLKRKQVPIEKATTADVALVYVSSWSSSAVAQRFVRFYADALPKRYSQVTSTPVSCQGSGCPLESFEFNTEEGFVSIERRASNLVLITESFEPKMALAVNSAILKANSNSHHAATRSPELSSRYLNSPVFADLWSIWEQRILIEAVKAFHK